MRTAKIGKIIALFIVLAIGALPFFVSGLFAQAGSHRESAKSVVKITARLANGKEEVGTGFVWSQPDYVVTALHVVAGAASITVYSEALKKERGATILNVLKESDLALLKLESNDLALAPLKVASTPPNDNEKHYIWGYPHDVNTMQGNDLDFSQGLGGQQQTMGSIFKSEAHFESVVGKQGYPKYQAKILRVGGTIQPGHSGAPIFDKSGAVVGVGDGGLHQGIARINWAIPAQIYLPALPASKDAKPTEPSKQANLYSASVSKPVEVKLATGEKGAAQNQGGGREEHALVLAWSAPLSEILATAEEREVEDIKELGLPDWSKIIIDVYEDYETGATIAVPQGTALFFDPEDRMVEAESENGHVRMIVYVAAGGGTEAKEYFDDYLTGLKDWQSDPEQEDEVYEEENYFELTKTRVTFDDDDEVRSDIFITMILEEEDFLGTAVMVDDVQALSPEDSNLYKLMLLCVELADFAID